MPSTALRVYFIRHGELDKGGNSPDPGLNDLGREQSKRLAAALSDTPFDYVFSSTLERAREVRDPFAALNDADC